MRALPPEEREARKKTCDKAYRDAHRKETHARYIEHRDEVLLCQAQKYAADPEKFRAKARDWYRINREKRRTYLQVHHEERRAKAKVYNDGRRDEIRAYTAANRERHRAWLTEHREQQRLYSAAYRASHSAYFRAAEDRRRGAPFVWTKMDPWPNDCQVCGEPIDPALAYPDPAFGSRGHEPPIAWLLRNPSYDGPLILRPEHYHCNKHKHDHPDWELPT